MRPGSETGVRDGHFGGRPRCRPKLGSMMTTLSDPRGPLSLASSPTPSLFFSVYSSQAARLRLLLPLNHQSLLVGFKFRRFSLPPTAASFHLCAFPPAIVDPQVSLPALHLHCLSFGLALLTTVLSLLARKNSSPTSTNFLLRSLRRHASLGQGSPSSGSRARPLTRCLGQHPLPDPLLVVFPHP